MMLALTRRVKATPSLPSVEDFILRTALSMSHAWKCLNNPFGKPVVYQEHAQGYHYHATLLSRLMLVSQDEAIDRSAQTAIPLLLDSEWETKTTKQARSLGCLTGGVIAIGSVQTL